MEKELQDEKWKNVDSGNTWIGWKKMYWSNNDKGPSLGFPLILLVVGIYWLGSELGVWPVSFSIWPVLLIALAGYWLIKGLIYKR